MLVRQTDDIWRVQISAGQPQMVELIDGKVYGKNIWSNFVTLLDIHDSDIEQWLKDNS